MDIHVYYNTSKRPAGWVGLFPMNVSIHFLAPPFRFPFFFVYSPYEDSIIHNHPPRQTTWAMYFVGIPTLPIPLRMFAKCLMMTDYGLPTTLMRILRLGNKVCSVAGTSSSRGPCPPLPSLVQTGKSTLLEKRKVKGMRDPCSQLVGFLVIRSSLFIPLAPRPRTQVRYKV